VESLDPHPVKNKADAARTAITFFTFPLMPNLEIVFEAEL
jgi:hypothetical protein